MIILPFLVSLLTSLKMNSIIDAIPFSWHVLFYSAVFFTSGNLIYQIFAPSIIKENNSFADYRIVNKNWSHLRKYAIELDLCLEDEEFNQRFEDYKNKIGVTFDFEVPENDFINLIEEKQKRNYIFLFDLNNSLRKTIPPSSYHYGHQLTPELEFNKTIHYGEELKKNSDYNLSIAFWKLYEIAKYFNRSAIVFSLILYFIGTIGVSIVMINSVWIVFKSDTFSIFN